MRIFLIAYVVLILITQIILLCITKKEYIKLYRFYTIIEIMYLLLLLPLYAISWLLKNLSEMFMDWIELIFAREDEEND